MLASATGFVVILKFGGSYRDSFQKKERPETDFDFMHFYYI
jgi:hypothetical protein